MKLCCDKSLHYLEWRALLSFDETVKLTADWYRAFYNGEKDMYSFTTKQIAEYTNLASEKNLAWAVKINKN